MLSEEPAAVADPDDHLSSSVVAGESSASGSGEWNKLERTRVSDIVTVCSVTTSISDYQLVQNILPNDMEEAKVACKSFSCSSCLDGGNCSFSHDILVCAKAYPQVQWLQATAEGKAAGASSAVAEVTPPAVDESANQGDLPEQSAARPAPGSAAKAPPPEPMWRAFVPDENPWPADEAMIPPQNCEAPPTYVQLKQLKDRMEDPNDPETEQHTKIKKHSKIC